MTAALFLFAHQDDEFGVFQAVLDEIADGRTVHCAYMTDGSYGGASPERRNDESLQVLRQLGVPEKNIHFAGGTLGIRDAFLHENAVIVADWINEWVQTFHDVAVIYVPAWEGGHHDHDALHAIAVTVASRLELLLRVRQFSLYNSDQCPGQLFKVFNPLHRNGDVIVKKIAFKNRCKFLRYCLSYPSQGKAWLGLFPFVVLHYLRAGTQQLQTASLARLNERPHEGKLYYEKRGYFTWEEMAGCITNLRASSVDERRLENSAD